MIDVTFLLIIFFLVSSHLAKQENFLKLDLPVANAGAVDRVDRPTVTVQVLPNGEYQVTNVAMPLDQVARAILSRMRTEQSALRIRIRTDRTTPYQFIASLLKVCSQTGNSDVVFAVYEETGS